MPGLSAFAPRGLTPAATLQAGHSWADASKAKQLTRAKLMTWLKRGGIIFRNCMVQEAPGSTGHGRSWINSAEDDTEPKVYVGILGPTGRTKGDVPGYMGMIEKGITPHFTPFSVAPGLRDWYRRTLSTAARMKPQTFEEITRRSRAKDTLKALRSAGGFDALSGLFVWKDFASHGGPRRERMAGGRIGIPWFSRGIKKGLPEVRTELDMIARQT